jgi:hypothetical protein
VLLVIFTYRLFAATRELVTDARVSAERQSRVMSEQQTTMQLQAQSAAETTLALKAQAQATAEGTLVLKAQAEAMEAIANAVGMSAQASKEAVEAVKAQSDVSMRHLIANNPPVLELRNCRIEDPSDGERLIRYDIVNTGGSPCTIVELRAFDDWSGSGRPLPQSVQGEEASDFAGSLSLVPGASFSPAHFVQADLTAFYNIRDTNDMPLAFLFLVVQVSFDDDNSVRREGEFFRRYDRGVGRYVAVREES